MRTAVSRQVSAFLRTRRKSAANPASGTTGSLASPQRLWSLDITVDMLAANGDGDRATAFIVLASIVVLLAGLALICWFFWTHWHDD